MPLPAVIEALDKVDASHHKFYSETDDGEADAGGKPLAASTHLRLEAAHRQNLDAVSGQAENYRESLSTSAVFAMRQRIPLTRSSI